MAKKNKKKRIGVVFSTDPDYDYSFNEQEESEAPRANQQRLRVSLDRKKRKGKEVTLVTGFIGPEADLKDLGKALKSKCGVGGSVKDGEILLQGDHRNKVVDYLKEQGYNQTKKSGG
ncbi:MAG: translation initiation factor [Saprospiraceae bacterium]|nr:translation initiation factor [Saprospiraceae bacterium]